ncbi:hypothetical protein RCO27_13575 [Sphingosinicella sp. LHD-64]|uniref:hypothetical protein n=1 Tax=Sphingosinicella sp. LHD-64 TaxID=3072139 RepID=UPI00280E3DCE|nr:hypothetical protein [Sphingosinicella sp. LHD-64]MDQ8757256.1 hypothetical protein [Sphingosinicella sp. LHD-64]
MAGDLTAIRENGAASGIGVLATFGHDDLGRRTSLVRGNGTVTSYAYDPVSRLASLGHDLPGAGSDLTLTFGYNPASQIASRTGTHGAYAFAFANRNTTDTVNGLNQVVTTGGTGVVQPCDGITITAPRGGGDWTYLFQRGNSLGGYFQEDTGVLNDDCGGWGCEPIVITARRSQNEESRQCRILRNNAEANSRVLPPYLTGNRNWGNPGLLRGYENYYQSNADQWKPLNTRTGQSVLVLAGWTFSNSPWGRAASIPVRIGSVSGRFGAGEIAGTALAIIASEQLALNENRARALDARADYLEAGCQGR